VGKGYAYSFFRSRRKHGFAVKNENAAEFVQVDYSVDSPDYNWINEELENTLFQLENDFTLCQIDFSHIEETANNTSFAIRLRFAGEDMQADDGNKVSFNNLALKGRLTDVNVRQELPPQELFMVHPNPTNGNYINLPHKMTVNIFDLQGRLLQRTENTDQVNIANLPSGVYLLQNNKGQWSRVVLQR
jgi:hypothetical protein